MAKRNYISDCPVYIETMTGHLEDVRRIEIQESNLLVMPILLDLYSKQIK